LSAYKSIAQRIAPQTHENRHTKKPTQNAKAHAGYADLSSYYGAPAISGSTIELITEPSLETLKFTPNANASSFPLNH
jgi:hypothetical protein